MTELEDERAALLRACREAVERALSQRRWMLLGREEWARRVYEHVTAGPLADPQRAAIHIYSQALHAACSGNEGQQRQNHAYAELFDYLYDHVRYRYPEVAEDAAQRAVERVFTMFATCRQPGAFLAFALQQLLDAARLVRRQAGLTGALHVISASAAGEDLAAVPNHRHPDPAARVIAGELRARFERLSDEFLRKHPRASQQLAALRLKYIDGLDEQAISRQLGKPTGSVYVLRARAIEKLREEPAWRALAAEFGIISEEV